MFSRAPVKVVASMLLGADGSCVNVTFLRGTTSVSVDFQRGIIDVQEAQQVCVLLL